MTEQQILKDAKNQVEQRKSQLQKVEAAAKEDAVAKSIVSAAAWANEMFNSTLSALAQPIYDVIREIKPVPTKLRSIVDVEGAKNGLYYKFDEMNVGIQQFVKQFTTTEEVPIEVDDYYGCPQDYPVLKTLEVSLGCVTEQDCLESGYTKIVQKYDPQWFNKLMETYPKPEERDIVAQQMEKILNKSIRESWEILQPMVEMLGGVINIPPICDGVSAVIDSIDGLVKLTTTSIPESQLNEMIAKKDAAEAKMKAEAEKAISQYKQQGRGIASQVVKSLERSRIMKIQSGARQGIKDAFKNLQAPKLPDDIRSILLEMKDAIIFVATNLSNIYLVLIFKALGLIIKVLEKILEYIGLKDLLRKIPLLGQIPQLIVDAESILTFVMFLPMSLISCIESILVRKWKMIQVASLPSLPEPLPQITTLPATAKDIAKEAVGNGK